MMKNEYLNELDRMEENKNITNICNSIKLLLIKESVEIKESIIENMVKEKTFTIKTNKGSIEWNICKIDGIIKLTVEPIKDMLNEEYIALLKLNDDSYNELVESIKQSILYNNYIIFMDNGMQIMIQTKKDLSNIPLPNNNEIEAYSFPQPQLQIPQNPIMYPPIPIVQNTGMRYKIKIAANTIKAIMYIE